MEILGDPDPQVARDVLPGRAGAGHERLLDAVAFEPAGERDGASGAGGLQRLVLDEIVVDVRGLRAGHRRLRLNELEASIDGLLDREALGEAAAKVDHAHRQEREERREEAELDQAGAAFIAGEGAQPDHPTSLTTVCWTAPAPLLVEHLFVMLAPPRNLRI